jgi:hypothetical protein
MEPAHGGTRQVQGGNMYSRLVMVTVQIEIEYAEGTLCWQQRKK